MNSRVLIIDDSTDYAEMLCSVLERLGHTGTVATNKQEAMYLLEEEDFDFVLLDLCLPAHKDALKPLPYVGFELLRHIREHFQPPEPRVIVMTAYEVTSQTGIRAMQEGADDYFSKNDSTVRPEDKTRDIVDSLQALPKLPQRLENRGELGSAKYHLIEFTTEAVFINGIQIEKPIWVELLQQLRRLTAHSSGGYTAKEIAGKLPTRVTAAAIRQRFTQLKKHLRKEHMARGLGDLDPDEIIRNPMGGKGYELNTKFCRFEFGQ